MPDTNPMPMQFPPGVYEVTAGGTLIFRVLALGDTKPEGDPPFGWIENREHWFSTANLKLDSALAASTIAVTYVQDLGSLQKVADKLADPSLFTFQMHALTLLTTSNWTSGVPSLATPAFYFESATTPAMQPLFQVSPTNQLMLTYITWFSPTNTLTGYFPGASPGASYTLGAKTVPGQVPTNGYYYRAP